MRDLKDAQESLDNREKRIQKTVNKLEKDMDLLGVSGVEDKL
jgi:hypothetical protein